MRGRRLLVSVGLTGGLLLLGPAAWADEPADGGTTGSTVSDPSSDPSAGAGDVGAEDPAAPPDGTEPSDGAEPTDTTETPGETPGDTPTDEGTEPPAEEVPVDDSTEGEPVVPEDGTSCGVEGDLPEECFYLASESGAAPGGEAVQRDVVTSGSGEVATTSAGAAELPMTGSAPLGTLALGGAALVLLGGGSVLLGRRPARA